jgi:alpha-N-arabinofuranosidase
MQRRTFLKSTFASTLATVPITRVLAERSAATTATVTIRAGQELGRINRQVYGHFLEHLENVIYGGIFDADSKQANASGIRRDVVAAIQEMGGAHILRWPGGNFASYYHWKDGIGPRASRPRRLDVAFNQYDSNHFGTDEYLELCRLLDCEPFITVNMGSGSVEEACHWVEYCRREKRQPPVRIWGLGNEHWGPWQVGYYTAEEYARKVQQYAQFMRVVEPDLRFVGVGHTVPEWNETVLRQVGESFDWLSIHLYGHRTHLDGRDDFESTVVTPVWFEREMRNMSEQIDDWERKSARTKPLEITLEEWNTRHITQGQLRRQSPRNITDALYTASVFNACHRLSRRVTMSNFVFLLNTHAPIVVQNDRVLRTATFDVFRLYATRSQPVAVQTDVRGETLRAPIRRVDRWNQINQPADDEVFSAPRLDASATRSADGKKLAIFLVNRDATQPVRIRWEGLATGLPPTATLHTLAAPSLTAVNTLERPDIVRSQTRTVPNWREGIELPAASVGVLEVES